MMKALAEVYSGWRWIFWHGHSLPAEEYLALYFEFDEIRTRLNAATRRPRRG